jgi:hypothetical protein
VGSVLFVNQIAHGVSSIDVFGPLLFGFCRIIPNFGPQFFWDLCGSPDRALLIDGPAYLRQLLEHEFKLAHFIDKIFSAQFQYKFCIVCLCVTSYMRMVFPLISSNVAGICAAWR